MSVHENLLCPHNLTTVLLPESPALSFITSSHLFWCLVPPQPTTLTPPLPLSSPIIHFFFSIFIRDYILRYGNVCDYYSLCGFMIWSLFKIYAATTCASPRMPVCARQAA